MFVAVIEQIIKFANKSVTLNLIQWYAFPRSFTIASSSFVLFLAAVDQYV